MQFDLREAGRLVDKLSKSRWHPNSGVNEAAAMLRAAIERVREERGYVKTLLQQADEAMERAAAAEKRVRELEDERDEMAPIISRAYELEHRIAAAEKVVEATRDMAREHGSFDGAYQGIWRLPPAAALAQALQEYDHD